MPPEADRLAAWAFWGALAFHAASVLAFALITRYPDSFDEMAHLAYVRWEALHPSLFPHFEAWRLPDGRLNYLTHPSPYYLVLAAIDAAFRSIGLLRLVNAAISTAAVAIILVAGRRSLPRDGFPVFAAVTVLFPKLGLLGGIISNDNAALLAAAVFFVALVEWPRRSWLMALALSLCGWTKLTALIMAALALAFTLLARRERPAPRHALAGLGLAAGLIPTAANFVRYHAAVYTTPERLIPLAQRPHLGFLEFARQVGWDLIRTWPAKDGASALWIATLVLILALGGYGAWRARRERPWILGLAAATLPSALIQLGFGWRTLQAFGWNDVYTARYYYVLWPGFAAALALLWTQTKGLGRSAAAALVGAGLVSASTLFALAVLLVAGRSMSGL
jgi:hypothetical protein